MHQEQRPELGVLAIWRLKKKQIAKLITYVKHRSVPNNDLSPGQRQVIIETNDWKLSIRAIGTYFSEILIEILTF